MKISTGLRSLPRHRRIALALVTVASAGVLTGPGPSTAGAATQLGQVSPGNPDVSCGVGNFVQFAASTAFYVVPSPGGVITRWSHRGDSFGAGSGRLQVWRPAGGANFTLVERSELQPFTASIATSFATRIPASTGDLLGLRSDGAGCLYAGGGVDAPGADFGSDPVPGETRTMPPGLGTFLLNVSAILEPDADGDGFGDETQDECPGQAGAENGCPPPDTLAPETAITKGPKGKTKKKFATFEFTSSEPGSSFECSFDGKPFVACISPEDEKVGKGKHVFEVRATDQAGNTDPTPATDNWKVKKKRKK